MSKPKAKSKPRAKRKPPVERVQKHTTVHVVLPALNCEGNESKIKAQLENGKVNFFEKRPYGDNFHTDPIAGRGIRLDVLEAVVAKLKEDA